jgi:hypothetical protein
MSNVKYYWFLNDGSQIKIPYSLVSILELSIETGRKVKTISAEYKVLPGNKLQKIKDITNPDQDSKSPNTLVHYGILTEVYHKMIPVKWSLLNELDAFLAVAVDLKDDVFISSMQGKINFQDKQITITYDQKNLKYPNQNNVNLDRFVEQQLELLGIH